GARRPQRSSSSSSSMHLNNWPLASHQRHHERQRRSSGDDGIEGSDHGHFAATGTRVTYPGHSSSSSSVSLSPSLVSISPGVLSGGGMSVSNSSIASTAASTASPTAGRSPCYQQHQQPSYGNNNDIGRDDHWRTESGASSTCSSGADERLSTADGGRVENVGSVEVGFPQFEQLQMPRGGGSSSSHLDGAFPDSRVNYNMNDRNATGHGINGGAFADGALSALTGGGNELYARQERQRSPPPLQRQQPNHRCDVGSWPPTHVFPDDLEILLEEDADDEGDESPDSPGVLYTANNNTHQQQEQQQKQPLKMELPGPSSWASSSTAKLYEAGAPQQQFLQPKEQHEVNDVGSPALSGGVVSSPSPEPYHPCSLLPLQHQHQQLQDVLDWPASPRLGGLQAPPSRALSPMAASSPVVFSTEGDFLQTLQSTGCGGSAAWDFEEGSTTTDNGSSDCSEEVDPVPRFPFHPCHHRNNNGCTFEDSLQSLVEEVAGGGGVSNCFDLADAAAEAATAAFSHTATVSRASGSKNLVFPAAAAAAAKVGTAAAAIVPRGVLEKFSLGKQLLVSPGCSSPVAAAAAAAAAPVSPPTSPPQTQQQQQAPKRKQRPAVGSGKPTKKVPGDGPKKQKKQPLQEQKNPSPGQLKIKIARKAKALGTGTPEAPAAAAEGRPRKAARTAATSVAKSPPKSGGVRKAAGRGGGSSTKRVKVSPSNGTPAPASPAVAAAGKDGDRFLDDKTRRSREKNRDHSRRSRERKKAQLEGLKQASIDLGPYRMLVEQAHDMISVHSADADAFFALASGAFYRQLGFEPTKMLGASLLDLVETKDVQAVVQAIMDTLSRGGIKQASFMHSVQYRMRPPSDGDAVEVETSFRMASRRLLAITRIVGARVPRSVSPAK
ncbi:unnamed protein product, partial [Ectocarpus sp. 6 AP-2014]